MPIWLVKYFMVLSGFYLFFSEWNFTGLVLGIIGMVWCIYNWKDHRK